MVQHTVCTVDVLDPVREGSLQAAVKHDGVPHALTNVLTMDDALCSHSWLLDRGIGTGCLRDQVVQGSLEVSFLLSSRVQVELQLLYDELLAEVSLVGSVDRVQMAPQLPVS